MATWTSSNNVCTTFRPVAAVVDCLRRWLIAIIVSLAVAKQQW
jgi:hypothetical protein